MMYALFAIGVEQRDALMCHYCDGAEAQPEPGVSAWEQDIATFGNDADTLIADALPREAKPGSFWVWVGERNGLVPPDEGYELTGVWSPASGWEIARFVAGAEPPVVFSRRLR
jgi:hypothetical protein